MKTKEEKKKIVEELTNLFNSYKTIAFIDFYKMPTYQFQQIKEKLRKRAIIKYVKKSLLFKAIENVRKEKFDEFLKYLPNQIGILFTNEHPIKIYKEIRKYASYREARAGDVAPSDIIIKPQITNLPPGPAISELQSVGLIVGIEKGKIAIKKEKLLVKKGETIDAKVANVLQKIGIKPIEVFLNITAMYHDGLIFPKEILEIREEDIINDLMKANNAAFNLALRMVYPTKKVVEKILEKCFKEAKYLSIEVKYPTKENIKDLLFKGYLIADNLRKVSGV